MVEKEILALLNEISRKLDKGEAHIKKNDWDEVGRLFSEITTLQERIKKNDPPLETLLSQSPSFKDRYEPLKNNLLEKTARVISVIEQWRLEQAEKITDSKNILDNIAKYYKPPDKSYYIDTKE